MYTILVVDDDDDIRNTLQEILEAEGYQTVKAANGQAALELLDQIPPPSLILLDWLMPHMTGDEFLVKFATTPHASIPVILLSAGKDIPDVEKAVAVANKPIDLNALLALVECHLKP